MSSPLPTAHERLGVGIRGNGHAVVSVEGLDKESLRGRTDRNVSDGDAICLTGKLRGADLRNAMVLHLEISVDHRDRHVVCLSDRCREKDVRTHLGDLSPERVGRGGNKNRVRGDQTEKRDDGAAGHRRKSPGDYPLRLSRRDRTIS